MVGWVDMRDGKGSPGTGQPNHPFKSGLQRRWLPPTGPGNIQPSEVCSSMLCMKDHRAQLSRLSTVQGSQ